MSQSEISSIRKKLDIDDRYLKQAWRNIQLEERNPLQNIVNFCHQQPFYHDYTDHLVNNGMGYQRAVTETETVAMGMLNLLYNPDLEKEIRRNIAQSIIMRLKFGFEMGKLSEEDDTLIQHDVLDIHIPSRANKIIDQIILNTKNAYRDYLINHSPADNIVPHDM